MWVITCPPDAYSAEDKAAFASRITDLYQRFGLPRFYVTVFFQEVAKENFMIGGEATDDFVRIWIDHIARRTPPDRARRVMELVNETLQPFVADRGFRWEVHVDDTPFEMWSIQGFFPPPAGSDHEKRWAAENKASAYELTEA